MRKKVVAVSVLVCVWALQSFGGAFGLGSVSVEETEFRVRRDRLLSTTLAYNTGDASSVPGTNNLMNIFGAYASTALRSEMWVTECNEVLRYICDRMGQVRGRLKSPTEENFTGMELARAYQALKNSAQFEDETRAAIEGVFKTYDFSPNVNIRSENHYLIFRSTRYLMAQDMSGEVFSSYGGKTGAQLLEEDGVWLKEFIRYRARQGWGEFDSGGYQFLSMNAILNLFDFSNDPELKKLSGMMVNLMLADTAVDTIHGLYGGARGRVYGSAVFDSGGWHGSPPMNDMNEILYLYFGSADPEPATGMERLLRLEKMNYWDRTNESLFSKFRPMKIVQDIMNDRPDSYVSLERKHLHNMGDPLPHAPLPGSIRKYMWHTPKYTLGTIQLQDAYPADHPDRNYAKHQQHDWDFVIPLGTKTRIFTHHPGPSKTHAFWSGDLGCVCTSTFQHETAVVAIFNIRPGEHYQNIHAYFPRAEFDEIIKDAGWIFARKGDVFAALYLSGGYQWTSRGEWKDIEVTSNGSQNASVFEAGTSADFGSFFDFCNQIKSNSVVFDSASLTLTYHSKQAGKIKISSSGLRQVNDVDANLDYPLYENPYMQSSWNSGVITLTHDGETEVFNFN